MTLVQLGLGEFIAYGLGAIGFGVHKREQKRRQSLTVWRPGPKKTMVVDGFLKKRVGHAQTAWEKRRADWIVAAVRNFVNRRIFDLLVAGAVNRNSKLRKWQPRMAKIGERIQGLAK